MYLDGRNLRTVVASQEDAVESKLDVVSFFAGCGGLDLGFRGGFEYRDQEYKALPYALLRAYDYEERCKSTYEANVGPHFETLDLATAQCDAMPAADVLIGGFPCQEFSICGPRGGTDSKRGKLYTAMSRYARAHQPLIVVGENVSHLPRINGGEDLSKIVRSFKRAGYRSAMWNVYAPDYGVPQARERVILLFIRNDIESDPMPPVASYVNNHRSVAWAIKDLLNITDESVPNQSQFFRAGLAKTGHGQGDEVSPRDLPGYTVRANAKSRVQFHYSLPRRLTVRECARLQTFPDTFVFPHAATTSIMQIGNAVPPVLGHAIAASLVPFLMGAKKLLKLGR